jgi:hypothetical protein
MTMTCYKCRAQLPKGQIVCAECGQPAYTRAVSATASLGRRIDGCLADEPSAKDYTAIPNLSSLPPRADLRANCSPVEDQGQIGSCVACTVVGALEYQERRAGRSTTDLSRMFVYYNARRLSGTETRDAGTTIPRGMAALLAYGAPPEDLWPYDPARVGDLPGDQAFDAAKRYVPAEYARVTGIEHVQGALFRQHPVIFSASLPIRCYDEAARTGVIPPPHPSELDDVRTEVGRHAMLLVGYDLNQGIFHVRNSWGRSWGDAGYCSMSIETFQAAAVSSMTWILGSLESAGDFTVTRPAVEGASVSHPVPGSVRDKAAAMRDEIRSGLTRDIERAIKDIRERVNPPRQGGQ